MSEYDRYDDDLSSLLELDDDTLVREIERRRRLRTQRQQPSPRRGFTDGRRDRTLERREDDPDFSYSLGNRADTDTLAPVARRRDPEGTVTMGPVTPVGIPASEVERLRTTGSLTERIGSTLALDQARAKGKRPGRDLTAAEARQALGDAGILARETISEPFRMTGKGLAESGYATAQGATNLIAGKDSPAAESVRQSRTEMRDFYGEPHSALGTGIQLAAGLAGSAAQYMLPGAGLSRALGPASALNTGSAAAQALKQIAVGSATSAPLDIAIAQSPEDNTAGFLGEMLDSDRMRGIAKSPTKAAALEMGVGAVLPTLLSAKPLAKGAASALGNLNLQNRSGKIGDGKKVGDPFSRSRVMGTKVRTPEGEVRGEVPVTQTEAPVPKALAEENLARVAAGLSKRVQEKGGFTFDPHGGKFVTKGYAVALGKDANVEPFVVDALTPETIQQFLTQNQRFFAANPDVKIGAWKDDAGKIWLEPSEVKANRREAVALGVERNELAVGDLAKYARGENGDIPLERLRFEHRSPVAGLTTLSGKFQGTNPGVTGAERSRPNRPGRVYVQDIGSELEPEFRNKSLSRYEVEVPKGQLYDASADPDGIIAKIGARDPDRWEKAIEKAGYAGYYVGQGGYPHYKMLFGDVPVATTAQAPVVRPITAPREVPRRTVDEVSALAVRGRKSLEKEGYAAQIKAAVKRGLPDVLDALATVPHAANWYKADLERMNRALVDMIPELADPTTMQLFRAVVAITSNGLKPVQNLKSAVGLFTKYLESGGDLAKLSYFDGPATRTITEKGGVKYLGTPDRSVPSSSRFNSHEFMLTRLKTVLGPDRAQWPAKLEQLWAERKTVSHRQAGTKERVTYTEPLAVSVFGKTGAPKLGRFYANLSGVAEDVTVDVWATRTLRRWLGYAKTGDEAVGAPSDVEGNVMRAAVAQLAQKASQVTGRRFDPMDIQALLWYYEKQRYTNLGAVDSGQISYADAAEFVRQQRAAGAPGGRPGLGAAPTRATGGGGDVALGGAAPADAVLPRRGAAPGGDRARGTPDVAAGQPAGGAPGHRAGDRGVDPAAGPGAETAAPPRYVAPSRITQPDRRFGTPITARAFVRQRQQEIARYLAAGETPGIPSIQNPNPAPVPIDAATRARLEAELARLGGTTSAPPPPDLPPAQRERSFPAEEPNDFDYRAEMGGNPIEPDDFGHARTQNVMGMAKTPEEFGLLSKLFGGMKNRPGYLDLTGKPQPNDVPSKPNEPEKVAQAALRMPDGRIFTGGVHAIAAEKAVDAGYPREVVHNVYETENDGFVTSRGRYLTRQEAYTLAAESGDIDRGEYSTPFELRDKSLSAEFLDLQPNMDRPLDVGSLNRDELADRMSGILKQPFAQALPTDEREELRNLAGLIRSGDFGPSGMWMDPELDDRFTELAGKLIAASRQPQKTPRLKNRPGFAGSNPTGGDSGSPFKKPNEPEKIAAAAVRAADGRVFTGAWHGEALSNLEAAGATLHPRANDGFVTSTGRYVSRRDAMRIAKRQDQLKRGAVGPDQEYLDSYDVKNIRGESKRFKNRPGFLSLGGSQPQLPNRPEGTGTAYSAKVDVSESDRALANIKKLNLSPEAEAKVRDAYQRLDLEKRHVTHEETREVANELGLNPARLLDKEGRLSGAELLAIRDVISSNAKRIVDLSNDATKPLLSVDDKDALLKEIGQLTAENDQYLRRYTRQREQAGRDLNALKIIARNSLDAPTWLLQAERIKGLPLTQQEHVRITQLSSDSDRDGLIRFVSGLRKSSAQDKLITLWKAGLLTSLGTHAANLTGNAAMAAAESVKEVPAALVDALLSLARGTERTKAPSVQGLVVAPVKGFFGPGMRAAKRVLRYGADPSELAKWDFRKTNYGDTPAGRFAQAYTDAVFNTLGAEDQLFRAASVGRSLEEQARLLAKGDKALRKQLVANPTPEMMIQAIADAEVAVFQNENLAAQAVTGVRRTLRSKGTVGETAATATEVVAPFVKTPSNIVSRTIEYSPPGLLYNTGKLAVALAKGVTAPDQKRLAEALGRGVTGSSTLFLLGFMLAREGKATGSAPKESNARSQWELEGKVPNGVLVGDTWRSFARLGPPGMVIATGAQAYEAFRDNETAAGKIFGALYAPVRAGLDQSFLQGVSGALEALNDPSRAGERMLENTAGSVIPSGIAQIARATDPYARDRSGVGDAIAARIPGLRQQLPTRLNAFGKPVREGGPVSDFIDPTRPTAASQDPLIRALEAADAKVGFPSRTVSGPGRTRRRLSDEEYRALVREVGPRTEGALRELLEAGLFGDTRESPDSRQEAVQATVSKVRAAASKRRREREAKQQSVQRR
jgi:hypothetical protein